MQTSVLAIINLNGVEFHWMVGMIGVIEQDPCATDASLLFFLVWCLVLLVQSKCFEIQVGREQSGQLPGKLGITTAL